LKTLEFFDRAEAARRTQFAANTVFAPLIVGRGTKPAGRRAFQFEAFQIPIEGKVEIQSGLFTVGDDVESGCDLVVDGGDDGVVFQFGAVGLAELVEVLAGKFQPAREWVAADDRVAKGAGFQ